MNEFEHLKRLGIRSLRLFGALCVFFGYVVAAVALVSGEFRQSGLGLGLVALGVPHILAANLLQSKAAHMDPKFARAMNPSVARLIAMSLLLPGSVLVLIMVFIAADPNPDMAIIIKLFIANSLVWLAGVWIVLARRAHELTRWDRAYIRWGWLALLANAIPITALLLR